MGRVCARAHACALVCSRWALKGERHQWGGRPCIKEGGSLKQTYLPAKCCPRSAQLTVKMRDGHESGGNGRKQGSLFQGVSSILRADKCSDGRLFGLPRRDLLSLSLKRMASVFLVLPFWAAGKKSAVYSPFVGKDFYNLHIPQSKVKDESLCKPQ